MPFLVELLLKFRDIGSASHLRQLGCRWFHLRYGCKFIAVLFLGLLLLEFLLLNNGLLRFGVYNDIINILLLFQERFLVLQPSLVLALTGEDGGPL
jgi:hypothetical protein